MKYNLTFGADPEFFVTKKTTPDKIEMACHKFGGAKGEPIMMTPDGGYLEDGTTVEFNVSPSSTLEECRKKIENLLLVFCNKFPEYQISSSSHASFNYGELKAEPLAMHIGCSADFWAYGLRTKPQVSKFKNLRFAGGHIHIGLNPWPEGLLKSSIIKMCDIVYTGAMSKSSQVDSFRYPYYGFPGLYRETDYGVEYRTPDNAWCNPTLYSNQSASMKMDINIRVETFTDIFSSFTNILNSDGHGARVNKYIEDFTTRHWDRTWDREERIQNSAYLRTGPEYLRLVKEWIGQNKTKAAA